MGPPTALLQGYYGARNVGDDLMLEFLLDWLRNQGLHLRILGEDPRAAEWVGTEAGFVKNVPLAGEWGFPGVWTRGDAWRVVSAIRNADHLVVGGGDLFRDDRGWRTFLYPFEKVLLALGLGKPVHLVNLGIGRPQTGYAKRLYAWALPRCKTILVRDRRSLEICREAGADQASQVPDAILAATPEAASHSPSEESYGVVALRFLAAGGKNVGMEEGRLRNLAEVLDGMISAGRLRKVVFVPFQDAPGWQDAVLHRRVQELMIHGDRCVQNPWSADLSQLVGVLREARLVVVMPLHAAVVSVLANASMLFLSYDHKCVELAQGLEGGVTGNLGLLDDPAALGEAMVTAMDGSPVFGFEDARSVWEGARLNL